MALYISDDIVLKDNKIYTAESNSNLELSANSSGVVHINDSLQIGTGATVTTILDEDAMGTNSATALATQQSIKAYVDSNAGTAWQSVITADPNNAVAGRGYFCNTTSGAFTVTLPTSATIGDEICFIDYAGTFDTNNLTIGRNSHNIQGTGADLTVATERAGFTLVFVDATQGWLLKEK